MTRKSRTTAPADVARQPAVARRGARGGARHGGLIKRWDRAAYDAVLAPAFKKPATQTLFDKMRAEHKTCTVGRPLEGDGGASAALRLDCAEGGCEP